MPLAFVIGDFVAMSIKLSPLVFIAPVGIPMDFIIEVRRTAQVLRSLEKLKREGYGGEPPKT